jgi:site-specific DNA recombinase
MKDFRYYRCTGTDSYRFGGERICGNTQIRADRLEAAIWSHVCRILKNPGSLEESLGDPNGTLHNHPAEDLEALKAQRQKLRHGTERLIDALAEGVIDKEQFTIRMNRAKSRLADLDARIASQNADEERRTRIGSAMIRLAELASHLQSQLKTADRATKREILRALYNGSRLGPQVSQLSSGCRARRTSAERNRS